MDDIPEKSSRLKRILYFFPIQLLLLHFKRNHLTLIFWLVLFGYVTGLFGEKYGIPYLFLTPEYQGEVNFISYGILGFATGGFFMAFNIYSYIMHGYKFRFIATVGRPFYKFSLNNAALPWIYVITYIIASIQAQYVYQLLPVADIVMNICSFMIGILGFIVISFLYFFRTNKDISAFAGEVKEQPVHSKLHNKKKWYEAFLHDQEWNVTSYMVNPFKIGIARDIKHYDEGLIRSIFSQNRINASYFEIIMIATFFVLGTFKETDWVMIPAGASIILLFTILIMLISILFSWFKGWTIMVVVAGLLSFHFISNQYDVFHYRSYAYGMDYSTTAPYRFNNVKKFAQNESIYMADSLSGIHILHNWKKLQNEQKPPLVIVTTSGGGSRSSLWTFRVLQYLDQQTDGAFFKHAQLITGSSGGMIGAAYYRELYLRDIRRQDSARFHPKFLGKISNDMLNSIAVTIATTDLLFRYQSFEDQGRRYTKDRGYMFERSLNRNTDYVMNKRLVDYRQAEASGAIPMMILAPTIVNDGKRLMISPQPISYMSRNAARTELSETHLENIEFTRLFEKQDAMNLKFTTALRMNATFPYVTPMVTLPSEPSIEIMDAGLRDNYGVKDAVKYISTFEQWIKENTSGVIVIQIRDNKKDFNIEHRSSGSLLRRVITPFSNVYGNILKTQDYNDDQLLDQLSRRFDHPIEYVHFDLMFSTEDRISLSWHLTTLEKERVLNSIKLRSNNTSVDRIKKLLNNQ